MNRLDLIIDRIIFSPELHAKWLNTLSYLENCGARKIAACEHPTLVREEMLKHAAEEFRHAHHLKRQIIKVVPETIQDYSLPFLLGGVASLHYLNKLDLMVSQYLLKQEHLSRNTIKGMAYLLVTYVIELRAEELYAIYHEALKRQGSRVSVTSIILEEKEHLNEMRMGLETIERGMEFAQEACLIENAIYENWLEKLQQYCSSP